MGRPAIQKLLRAVRAASPFRPPAFRWEPGMLQSPDNANDPFKPGYAGRTRAEADAAQQRDSGHWGGDRGTWEDALRHARVGHRLDFYVYHSATGELETNIGVLIVSETEAFYCDTGETPVAISAK